MKPLFLEIQAFGPYVENRPWILKSSDKKAFFNQRQYGQRKDDHL